MQKLKSNKLNISNNTYSTSKTNNRLKNETAKEFLHRLLKCISSNINSNDSDDTLNETLTMFTHQEMNELSDMFSITDCSSDLTKMLIKDGWSDFKIGYILGGKQIQTAINIESILNDQQI